MLPNFTALWITPNICYVNPTYDALLKFQSFIKSKVYLGPWLDRKASKMLHLMGLNNRHDTPRIDGPINESTRFSSFSMLCMIVGISRALSRQSFIIRLHSAL